MQFEFTKWQGAGNDFVIVNGFKYDVLSFAKMAAEVCDRHFGIGADGLVFVLPSTIADFQMRIFNADGSEAEMCGNVTRCVARYVYEEKMTDKTSITIETLAGIMKPELVLKDGQVEQVKVNMGMPRLASEKIPAVGLGDEPIIGVPITVLGTTYDINCVSMGNPHCVIFVDDVDSVELATIGSIIENLEFFPQKTNVEFAQINNKDQIRMRVWERGSGITMACGTGACATLVAAILNSRSNRQAELVLDGGSLWIEWGNDGYVYMSGAAERVFSGVYQFSK